MSEEELIAWVIFTNYDIEHIQEEMKKQTDYYNKLAEEFGWKPLSSPCGLFYVRVTKDPRGDYYVDTLSFSPSCQEEYRKAYMSMKKKEEGGET